MSCRLVEMRNKEVISLKDGTRLGSVCDVEIDTCTGRLTAIVIYGRPRFLGLFGRENDLIIDWDNISVIGEDTILVTFDPPEDFRFRRRRERIVGYIED